MPYIPGTANVKRKRTHKKWHLHRVNPIYIPAHIKATRDLSEFYEKSPEEMSRYELEELEKILKMTEEEREAYESLELNQQMAAVQFDEDGNQLTVVEQFKLTDQYKHI